MAVEISEDLSSAEHQSIRGCFALVVATLVPEIEKAIVEGGHFVRSWKRGRLSGE